jgi:regulator of sirC expression with transglutaminase-like and TPR domain
MEFLERFAAAVAAPEEEIDLALGALLIAGAGQPGLDTRTWLAALDTLAAGVTDLLSLCRRLFVELGFRGDTRNYYSPANSFVDRVLERRRGIPITLSVVTLEVARRARLRLEPIGMPGHFLVRDPETGLYVDSFGAAVLDDRGCEALFRDANRVSPEAPFTPDLRPVVGPRAILDRMLGNLAASYRMNAEPAGLEWVLRMRMAIPGSSPDQAVALATAIAAQGRVSEAAAELENRAAAAPGLADKLLPAVRSLRAQLN